MGSLRDEVYENLDYLSQLTEIVIGPQNVVLGKLPDRLELSLNDVLKFKCGTWRGKYGFELSGYNILTANLPSDDWQHINDIKKYFKFEISPDLEIDFNNNKMTGTLALVKVEQQIDEKKLLEMAVYKAQQHVSYYNWPVKRLRDKIATVLNTFEPGRGTEWAQKLSGKTQWSGATAIRDTISYIILENKWRIRDASVIEKIGKWVNSYLEDETDTSTGLVNLLKLRMMLNKDLPVYSLGEVKNAQSP